MSDHKEHIKVINLPKWAWPPFQHSLYSLLDENKFLHLSMSGLGQITKRPEIAAYFRDLDLPATRDTDWDAEYNRAKEDAEWVENEIRNGFPILHSHFVVSIWGILEAFSEDMAVCWLVNNPEAWKLPQLSKVKVPIGKFEGLSPKDRARLVILEVSRSMSLDFKRGLGKLDPPLHIFALSPKVGNNVRRAIHELCQIRNAIVHCGSRADRQLLHECPWVQWKPESNIKVDHKLAIWYCEAAHCYIQRVLSNVLISQGLEGCNCPGMDNISDRPASNSKEGEGQREDC